MAALLRRLALVLVALAGASEGLIPHMESRDADLSVLSQHRVEYSEARISNDYLSSAKFDPRGMQHVYTITHLFLDLVQRKDALPQSFNVSEFFERGPKLFADRHRDVGSELLIQYIGVLTIAVCGLLAAVAIPVAGFCVCCCRCAGKCGGYPEHFDKKGDACRRVFLGVVLSIFVIAAMFGVVSAFVTNHYGHQGIKKLPRRLADAADDTSQFLSNTGAQVEGLLVTNFEELEKVLNKILDESGPIMKRNLAQVTKDVAMENLQDIVSGLGDVKKHLKDIQNKTLLLQDKVGQLQLGLDGSKRRLNSALRQCGNSQACVNFLQEFDIDKALKIAKEFVEMPFELPDVGLLMNDIADLVEVEVKVSVENSVGDIGPPIKKKIRQMGVELSEKSSEIQNILNEFDVNIAMARNDIPRHYDNVTMYGNYLHYIGLGMCCLVLLVLCCHIFGLFFGFCGKRPGNVYGDDCCNTGTGANWLLSGVYLTFMFSFVLLVLTTAHFLVGSSAEKLVCEALHNPNDSDIFRELDDRYYVPVMRDLLRENNVDVSTADLSLRSMMSECHRNHTVYTILKTENLYDVQELRRWRQTFGVDKIADTIKSRIVRANLEDVQILSPSAQKHLEELAESQLSDLNFTKYTKLFAQQITKIDLNDFIERIREVKRKLNRSQLGLVGAALENEALFLSNMNSVVLQMKEAMRQLKSSVTALEKEARLNKSNFKQALRQLISEAARASDFLRRDGSQLIDRLANKYVNETVGLIDGYVDRVINRTRDTVGQCHPISRGYNATVISLCNEIVDPFNGFWASIGWCYVFYLPSVALALALVSLYRKSEPYPGPLVEARDHDEGPSTGIRGVQRPIKKAKGKNGRGRGHRRNPSEYLPDSAHHRRAGYSYQSDMEGSNRFQDAAPSSYSRVTSGGAVGASTQQAAPPGGPPRYTSNPNLANMEYERPPPYYFPGASAPSGSSDIPPPLPAPNRT